MKGRAPGFNFVNLLLRSPDLVSTLNRKKSALADEKEKQEGNTPPRCSVVSFSHVSVFQSVMLYKNSAPGSAEFPISKTPPTASQLAKFLVFFLSILN